MKNKKSNKKSQSAIEFMTVVALGIILIGVASFFGADYITSYLSDSNIINARQTINSITSASNLVYAQSVGAQTKFMVSIPRGIDRAGTYVSSNRINIRFTNGGTKDIFRETKPQLFGSIPTISGNIYLTIEMRQRGEHMPRGAYMYIDDFDVSMIFVGTYKNETRQSDYFNRNFNSGDDVYYRIILENNEKERIDSSLDIHIYDPDRNLNSSFQQDTSNGIFDDSFKPTESGVWLISVMIPETKNIGTALVWVD